METDKASKPQQPPKQQTDLERTQKAVEKLEALVVRTNETVDAFYKAASQITVGMETLTCMVAFWKHLSTVEENYSET